MKWLLLSISIIFTLNCYSQKQEKDSFDLWLEKYNAGIGFFNKEDYKNAIPKLSEALQYIEQIDFSANEETRFYAIENYYNLGICYFKQENFAKAIPHLEAALEITKQLEGNHFDYINGLLFDLGFAYSNIDLKKSLETRQEIIKRLNNANTPKDFVYAQMLYHLAFSYRNIGDTNNFHETLKTVENVLNNVNETNGDFYAYTAYFLGHHYFAKDDYEKASDFFTKAEALKTHIEADPQVDILSMRYLNGVSLFNLDDYQRASDKLKSLLQTEALQNSENIELYSYVVDKLAQAVFRLGDFNQAKQYFEEGLATIEKNKGKDNAIYALLTTNFAKLLIDFEDYDKALEIAKEAHSIYIKINSQNSNGYLTNLNNLGLIHLYKADYKTAETYFKDALSVATSIKIDTVQIQSNLALVYQSQGDYEKAKALYKNNIIKTKNNNDSQYAILLMNYGNLLTETGEYLNAEQNFLKAFDIFKATIGTDNLLFAKQLINIGQFYLVSSQLKKGLESYNKAVKIYTSFGKDKSHSMALALNGKALCLQKLGNYDAALDMQLEAYAILNNETDKNHKELGLLAQNLGATYFLKKNFTKAADYYKIAYDNYEKVLKTGHQFYGNLLANYSELFIAAQRYEEAHEYLDKTLKNYELNYGKQNIFYAATLLEKGIAYFAQRQLDEALKTFKNSETILTETQNTESDIYSNTILYMAMTQDLLNNKAKANEFYMKYSESFNNQLKDVFTYNSEEEKKEFLKKFEISNNWINSSIFNPESRTKTLIELGVNNQLILKSLLLNASRDVLYDLASLNKEDINRKIDKYRSLKKQMADASLQQQSNNRKTLKENSNTLETDLVKLHHQYFNSNTQNFEKDYKAIKNKLTDNEIAVDFVTYKSRNNGMLLDTTYYGAFLLHKNWEQPKIVPLFKEDDLKTILKNQNPNALYQTRGSKAKSTTSTKGLYELVWQPLEAYLNDIETIYYSPIGLLNQIPFAALDTEEKSILAAQYHLIQLASTYSITEKKVEPKMDNSLFIGGITYDYNSEKKSKIEEIISELSTLKSVSGTRSLGSTWNYLAGTLEEVHTIQNLFSKNNKNYTSLSAENATETAFKNLSGNSPSIIHIATHGFFFENPKSQNDNLLNVSKNNIYSVSEDPLLRSGLLFAGANYAWQNGNNPNETDDGILTALEISNLDLSKTDMVVLSACETGLGDIDGSEGVYGLQRAFKMAGVDIIVMSLWEVPDAETSEFMTSFYTNWLNGEDVRTAFRNTQLKMANTYKDSPEKWAAFVLFE